MKGAQTVFLYRFMRFMENNRGNGDLMKWMTRFQIDGRRLEESWTDLCPELDLAAPAIVSLTRKWGLDEGGGRCVLGGPFFSMAEIG